MSDTISEFPDSFMGVRITMDNPKKYRCEAAPLWNLMYRFIGGKEFFYIVDEYVTGQRNNLPGSVRTAIRYMKWQLRWVYRERHQLMGFCGYTDNSDTDNPTFTVHLEMRVQFEKELWQRLMDALVARLRAAGVSDIVCTAE